jgi:hypothetical protein
VNTRNIRCAENPIPYYSFLGQVAVFYRRIKTERAVNALPTVATSSVESGGQKMRPKGKYENSK